MLGKNENFEISFILNLQKAISFTIPFDASFVIEKQANESNVSVRNIEGIDNSVLSIAVYQGYAAI